MDKELRRALTEMTGDADPGRVENAVRDRICGAENPIGTRRIPGGYRRPVRAVLAAVMVLMLAMSGYAAVQKLMTVTLPEEGPYDVVVEMPEDAGRMIVLPEEKRKELQAHVVLPEDIKNGVYAEKERRFDTWTEAAVWLDCGMLTSDLLTEKEREWAKDLGQSWGNVNLLVNNNVYPTLGERTSINLSGTVYCSLLAEDEFAWLSVRIPLSGDWESYGHAVTYSLDKMYESEDAIIADLENHEKTSTDGSVTQYTTASGIRTEIAVLTVPKISTVLKNGIAVGTERIDSIQIHLFFLHEGILYELHFSAPDAESGTETAKAIAESMK